MLGIMARELLKNVTPSPAKNFTIAPTSLTVAVGATGTSIVSVSGGLDITTIRVVSSDTAKATASISGTTITVTGVAKGSATITVSSTDISKTLNLVATINDAPVTYTAKLDNENKKLDNTKKGSNK